MVEKEQWTKKWGHNFIIIHYEELIDTISRIRELRVSYNVITMKVDNKEKM